MINIKKTVLVFIDWFEPGYKAGGPIRSVYNMIEHLSDSHKFCVVTRNTDYLETVPYPKIESDKWIEISDNKHLLYLSKQAVTVKRINEIIKTTHFDIIYINGVFSFYFSLLPLFTANKLDKKIIVASRGMLSAHSLGVKSSKKKLFLIALRWLGFYKKTNFHVNSKMEAQEISSAKLKQESITVVPNLHSKNNTEQKFKDKTKGILNLVSIARISPEKNTLYAIESLANFKYKGKIKFNLYGSIYNNAYWEECEKAIERLPKNITVKYNRAVHNSLINKILHEHHFMFMPSGENFGHSIVESLLAGCPVIISDQTPWRNLNKANAGWDISLEKQNLFAEAIQKALDMDKTTYNLMQKCANDYINSNIDTKKTISLYHDLFDN